ncbi:hypothetical protein PUN28_002167 [Cardiocondyla obscurior]|uniref:Uncharacterized protein n=1 Tax=Cardiocondyla obscurior TaxID=286306 RepID=A0AAW2GSW5_9HYME
MPGAGAIKLVDGAGDDGEIETLDDDGDRIIPIRDFLRLKKFQSGLKLLVFDPVRFQFIFAFLNFRQSQRIERLNRLYKSIDSHLRYSAGEVRRNVHVLMRRCKAALMRRDAVVYLR